MGEQVSGKGGRHKTLTPRDIKILIHMWRWKIVSTATIFGSFFPSPSGPHAAYLRLCHLQKLGLIEKQFIVPDSLYWCLTKKGFDLIRPSLPSNVSNGFQSDEPAHDAMVTAVQRGPWTKRPEGASIFSEQELRCLPLDAYPSWVPNTDLHRPDGYWLITLKGKSYLIALEVELHQKADKEYSYAGRFYSEQQSIFRVVWVVPRRSFGEKLYATFKEIAPNEADMHNFVLVEDVYAKGWTAPVFLGKETAKPLAFLLDRRVLKTPEIFQTLWNLDGRLCPYNLSTSAKSSISHFCNCPVFQTVPRPDSQLGQSTPQIQQVQSVDLIGQQKSLKSRR